MAEYLGLVVLFHPDEEITQRIKTYLFEVSELLIVDNSEPPSPILPSLAKVDSRILIVANGFNGGIAYALNQGIDYGLKNGYDWLLTMDQDSFFEPGAIKKMKDCAAKERPTPGIISPFHHTPGAVKPDFASPVKELMITMTSGNLLNLKAAKECGHFDEKLFIDSVDHDYCLRLRKKGYRIVRINDAVLNHNLGEIRYRNILGLRIKTSNHSATRRYYMTRNRLKVMTRHFWFDVRFFRREFMELLKSFLAVSLIEDHKSQKLSAMLRGVWHFLIGRYGKI